MDMTLSKAKSLCGKNQRLIVSSEKRARTEHRAINADLNEVRQYRLDGGLVKNKTCCDYLLLNDTKKNAYFIELKGRDITKGIRQLEAGVKLFKDQLPDYQVLYRLVHTKARTLALKDSEYKKFAAKHHKAFICKGSMLEEII